MLKWLSVFTSRCPREGRGLRGEARTARDVCKWRGGRRGDRGWTRPFPGEADRTGWGGAEEACPRGRATGVRPTGLAPSPGPHAERLLRHKCILSTISGAPGTVSQEHTPCLSLCTAHCPDGSVGSVGSKVSQNMALRPGWGSSTAGRHVTTSGDRSGLFVGW